MNISDKFLTALVGSVIALVQVQLAVALSFQEVDQIAKAITVVITGKDGKGSGIIVEQKDYIYYVLTAHHVIDDAGVYAIQTQDGKCYPFFTSQRIGNFDLALIGFRSQNPYKVAQKSQSRKPNEGDTVYYAGYPYERNKPRTYRFFEAKITEISSNAEEGYDLSYDGEALPGMSGGPLLDAQGRLIGIHGKRETVESPIGTKAIPIEYYERLRGNIDFDRLQPASENESSSSATPEYDDECKPISQEVESVEPPSSAQPTPRPQYPIPYRAINDLIQAQKSYYLQRGYFTGEFYNLEVDLPSDYNFAIRTTTRSAYHYAIPDNPNQKAYVSATFLERNSTADNPQMVSIICEANELGRTRPADPAYRVDGSLICSRGTQEVTGNK